MTDESVWESVWREGDEEDAAAAAASASRTDENGAGERTADDGAEEVERLK